MEPPASPPARMGPTGRLVLAAAIVLSTAALFQAGLRRALDLRDLPGPGGVKVLTALATGDLERDGLTRLAAPLLAVTDPLTAVQVVVAAGALAAVAGAMLAAGALAGRHAALIAGLVAMAFGQGATASVMLGPDAPAQGLTWLGVGLAWWGARRGGASVVLVAVGVVLAVGGAVVKVNAAPALALLAITPLLVPARHLPRLLATLAALAVGVLIAKGLVPDRATQQATTPTVLSLDALVAGFDAIRGLPDRQHPAGTPLLQLAAVGLVGALLPGPRWVARVATAVVGLGAAALAAVTVGDLLRPRYLLAAMLPAVVLAGALGGLPLRTIRRPRLRAIVGLAAAAALSVPLLADTVAFLEAWDAKRVTHLATARTTLPDAPDAWRRRYARMSDLVLTDTSEVGALTMVLQATTAPAGGVATVPLRDAREFHLSAGASLAGHPYRILEARRCCEGRPLDECAVQVVEAMDEAGARLLLPRPIDGRMRVPRPHQAWWNALRKAADQRGGATAIDTWWTVREGKGTGGTMPCAPATPAPGRPGSSHGTQGR